MKTLDITPISDSAQFKFKKGTLKFLQDASKEALAAIMYALIGQYNNDAIYIIYGCEKTGSGSVYNYSAGAVFYQGEIYEVDATTITETTGNVAIFIPETTQYAIDADPVTFSDNSIQNIHDIRKLKIVAGFYTTTGFIDYYSEVRYLILKQIGVEKPNPVLYAGLKVVGSVPSSSVIVEVSFPDIGTANYYISGSVIAGETPYFAVSWIVVSKTSSSFTISFQTVSQTANNVSFEYILFAK